MRRSLLTTLLALLSIFLLSACEMTGRSKPTSLRGSHNRQPATVQGEWGTSRAHSTAPSEALSKPATSTQSSAKVETPQPEQRDAAPAEKPEARVASIANERAKQRRPHRVAEVKWEASAIEAREQPKRSAEQASPRVAANHSAASEVNASPSVSEQPEVQATALPPVVDEQEQDPTETLSVPDADAITWLKITGNVSKLRGTDNQLGGPEVHYDLWIAREGDQSAQAEFVDFMNASEGVQHIRRKLAFLLHSYSEDEARNLNFPAKFEAAAIAMIEEETGEPIGIVRMLNIHVE